MEILVLAIVNLLIVMFFGPLFEGVVRKYVRANIAHSRVGPLVGIWQPFLDLFKLLSKEDLEVSGTPVMLQRLAPVICLGSILAASLLLPITGKAPLDAGGDAIVFLYLTGIGAVAIIIGAMATGSPFAYAGATREMMLFLIVEPVLLIAILAVAVSSRSLRFMDMLMWHLTRGPSLGMLIAAIAVLMSLQAHFGKVPFDIPEAEQEIIGGPFIEMSGPKLALFKWAIWCRQFVFASLLVTIFVPWGRVGIPVVDAIITLLKILVVYVLVSLIEVVNPRVRIDQALRFYLIMVITATIGLAIAYVVG